MQEPAPTILHLVRRLGWWGAAGISVGLALVSLALATVIVVGWPVDQFKGDAPPPFWAHRHPVIRGIGLVGKNLAGYATVLLGIVMALPGVPGQGLILILIGLTMLNFPGKRRLELKLIRRPSVLRVVNRLRVGMRRLPLEVD